MVLLDSHGMVSYQWPIVKGFNHKNALGQSQKCARQSQDPETGWAVSESGKRPWPISRLPRILKMPMGNLEIAPNPENARNVTSRWRCLFVSREQTSVVQGWIKSTPALIDGANLILVNLVFDLRKMLCPRNSGTVWSFANALCSELLSGVGPNIRHL